MSSRRRSFTVAVLCALAVSAAIATTASASWEWVAAGVPLSVISGESESIEQTGGTFVLKGTFAGVSGTVSCEKQSATGTITAGGKGTATLKFSGCKSSGLLSCKVVEPITASTKTELTNVENKAYLVFSQASESEFTSITLEGCLLAGKYTIKGTLGAQLTVTASVEKALTFSPKISEESKTELKLGEKVATVEGVTQQKMVGPNKGQKGGPSPFVPKPGLVKFPKTAKGNTSKEDIIITNVTKDFEAKFAEATIVGGAGVFGKPADVCSKTLWKGGDNCKVTVSYTPANAGEMVAGSLVMPWENKAGTEIALLVIGLSGES